MRGKEHTKYKNAEGKLIPGVTTVIHLLNLPALAPAANKLGLRGIDSTKYWGQLADIGTLAHNMISCSLKGIECDTSEYTPDEIDKATNSHLSYLEWAKKHKVEPVYIEEQLVSEQYQFGGTPDLLCLLDDGRTLIDFKTGAIYPEAHYQIAAYKQLFLEAGFRIDKAMVLGIPRTEDEKFEEVVYTEFDIAWEIFYHLLMIYNLRRDMS